MYKYVAVLMMLVGFSFVSIAKAEDAPAAKPAKLKVLYITGGGFHDYKTLTPFLTEKIAKYANVEIDVKWMEPAFDNPKLGEGYDAIIFNFCFGKEFTKDKFENAYKPVFEGKPAVMLHCSMHCFKPSDEWTDCCGMRTRAHDPFTAFAVEKATKDHPLMKTFPDDWKTAGDELYQTIKFGERSTALLKAKSPKTGQEHICAWVSTYGKGKVFGTTLGHDLKTCGMESYQQLVANGLLWACGKLGEDGKPLPGYEGDPNAKAPASATMPAPAAPAPAAK